MADTPGSFLEVLGALRAQAGSGRLPPVHLWNPDRCSTDGNFEIRTDGSWRHEGSPIGREAMVRLFSSILRKDEDGETYLVTPGEKVLVKVEDAAFLAVRVDRVGEGRSQCIAFTTNVGDVVAVGADNPIRVAFDRGTLEPRPYVLVRGRLEARILRAPFYELVDWATSENDVLGLWSQGVFFPIGSHA
ncbi:MAG: DUF1285 domain-containing protein [Caulobacterales bacterium]|jgi:hypothetical protein